MLKWDEFVQEFKDENDNIKPSDQFKEQLSAMVKEESSSNVIPFRRNYKKIGAVAASFAVLVIGVGVYGIMGNINSDKSKISENMNMVAGMNDDAENLDDQSDSIAGTYHFSPDNADSDVYGSFAGEYKQSGDAAVTDGYLSIVQSPNELSIRFFGAEEWTKTSDIKVQEDGSIEVRCEYYVTEAEPDDLLVFTLSHQDDEVLMTVVESEFPFLQEGDTVLFTKY